MNRRFVVCEVLISQLPTIPFSPALTPNSTCYVFRVRCGWFADDEIEGRLDAPIAIIDLAIMTEAAL